MRNRLTWRKKSSQDLGSILTKVTEIVTELLFRQKTMSDLIAAAERRRLDRSEKIRITAFSPEPDRLVSTVKGETDIYTTRITLRPKRGHFCTCQDWQQRGRSVGPCKHVLALAQFYTNELAPKVNAVENELDKIVDLSLNF